MKTLRLALLIAFYFIIAAATIRTLLVAKPGPTDLLISLCTAIVVTWLCIADSRLMGRPMVQSTHWIMFFTWPVAVPIYLVWMRGMRGLLILLAHVCALFVMVVAIAIVIQEALGIEPA